MYLRHFGLEHKPFAITPDPRFLYLSERYREALAHLLYGVGEGGGFVLLTGEVGTGKTTLCRGLLEQLPDDVDAALVINPSLTAGELLAAICDELHLERSPSATGKALVDLLNGHLLSSHAGGRRTVLIIDEAQLLGPEALEQVRLLTNLETHTDKLLQVILIGQPELRDLLGRPGLRQLAQRVTARYHLDPLTRDEFEAYIDHRLRLAGTGDGLFTRGAQAHIHRASRGIPRLVNSLCDRALLGAYAQGASRVDTPTAARAATEVLGHAPRRSWRLAWITLPLLAGIGFGGWLYAKQANPPATAPRVLESPGPTPAPAPKASPTTPLPVVAEPPAPPPPDPVGPALHADRAEALARLATVWGSPAAQVATDCDTLPLTGLGCFTAQGSWAALQALDRPAVLTLGAATTTGEPRYAVVVANDDNRVELLAADGTRYSVDRDTLLAGWYGRFELLWQPPGAPLLIPGERSAAVTWLRTRLDDASSTATDPTLFDSALGERVLAFQQAHGLTPDGLVGQQTMLKLDLLAGPGPRLTRAAD